MDNSSVAFFPASCTARLEPSPSAAAFCAGGALLRAGRAWCCLLAFGPLPGMAARLALLGLACLILWAGGAMRRGTAVRWFLTGEGLFESVAGWIARRARDERGSTGVFFAFNLDGFLVHLSAPALSVWSPGLWWRIGRRVGTGGVVPAAEAGAMADRPEFLMLESAR